MRPSWIQRGTVVTAIGWCGQDTCCYGEVQFSFNSLEWLWKDDSRSMSGSRFKKHLMERHCLLALFPTKKVLQAGLGWVGLPYPFFFFFVWSLPPERRLGELAGSCAVTCAQRRGGASEKNARELTRLRAASYRKQSALEKMSVVKFLPTTYGNFTIYYCITCVGIFLSDV